MKTAQDVINAVAVAETKADIKVLVAALDDDYRDGKIEMSEEDWPRLSSAVAKRCRDIDNPLPF